VDSEATDLMAVPRIGVPEAFLSRLDLINAILTLVIVY